MRIEIVQRGRVLRQHNFQGRNYIEAPPEGEYTIRLTNTNRPSRFSMSTGRQLAVVSVDGLNIITGEQAGFDGPGYVVLPGQSIEIPGWRRTDAEVAAFQFKTKEGSYTAQMGNGTSNTGVIGLAVFNEAKPIKITNDKWRTRETWTRETWTTNDSLGSSLDDKINARAEARGLDSSGRMKFHPESANVSTASADAGGSTGFLDDDDGDDDGYLCSAGGAAAAASEDYSSDSSWHPISERRLNLGEPLRRVTRKAPELGTGYGGRRTMYTTETEFKRATEVPAQVITLQYAVRAKLLEWGVPLPELPPSPSAFPASAGHSAPAPPGWRG